MAKTIPIHVRVPGEAYLSRGDDGLPRLVGKLGSFGVSSFWFDVSSAAALERVRGALGSRSVASLVGAETTCAERVRALAAGAIRAGAGGVAVGAGAWRAALDAMSDAGKPPDAIYLAEAPGRTAETFEPGGRGGHAGAAGSAERSGPVERYVGMFGEAFHGLTGAGVEGVAFAFTHPDPLVDAAVNRALSGRFGAPQVLELETTGGPPSAPGRLAALIPTGALFFDGVGDALLVGLPRGMHAGGSHTAGDADRDGGIYGSAEAAVAFAKDFLGALDLHPVGYRLISCPTCGRCELDVEGMAASVDEGLKELSRALEREGKSLEKIGGVTVAVMGCNVNGPGEARAADIGIAGGRNGAGTLFVRGRRVRNVDRGNLAGELLKEVERLVGEKFDRSA